MDIEENQVTKKKGLSKGLIISIVVALLVIGGGVAAYVSMNNPSSPKAKYLMAEKNTMDFVSDVIEERFESELAWVELSEENPTETNIELSAEYNDPFGGGAGFGAPDPAEFINNSVLNITAQSDFKGKKIAAEVAANVAGIEINDISVYLTENKFSLGLPFLNELLQIKDEDVAKLLNEAMPELVSADEDIDFGKFFDSSSGLFSEEDIEHFKKEYVEMVLKDLPEEAFTASKEKVDINGESSDAEKVTLDLSEDDVKKLLTSIFDKLSKDEVVKDIIKDQFSNQLLGLNNPGLVIDNEVRDLINDYEAAMEDAKEEIQDFHFPNGITSSVWVDDKLIVKRDFSIEMGPNENDLVTFTIDGTQKLTDDHQVFSYDLGFKDSYDEGTMNVTGDLTWEDDKIKDSIKLIIEDIEIAYEADETLKKGDRQFDRSFSLLDEYGDGGKFLWSGTSSYEKDTMNSTHDFAVEFDDFGQDIFSLHAKVDGKQIKEVTIPEENVKDLGSMTIDEIEAYIEEDAAMQFQQWLMNMMMGAGGDFGF